MNDGSAPASLSAIIDRLAAVTGYEIDWAAMPPVVCTDPDVVRRLCTIAATIAAAELEADLCDQVADHYRDMMTAATSDEDIDQEVRALASILNRREERRDQATIQRGKLRAIFDYLRDHDATFPAVDKGQPDTDAEGGATAPRIGR